MHHAVEGLALEQLFGVEALLAIRAASEEEWRRMGRLRLLLLLLLLRRRRLRRLPEGGGWGHVDVIKL